MKYILFFLLSFASLYSDNSNPWQFDKNHSLELSQALPTSKQNHSDPSSDAHGPQRRGQQKESETDSSSSTGGTSQQESLSTTPGVETFWLFHKWGSLGYRRDRQNFSDFRGGVAQSAIDFYDRNTIQAVLGSHIEYKALVYHMRGTFGWLINGSCDYALFPERLHFKKFQLGSGYSAEASGALGIRWVLYSSSPFQFSLIPWIGYRYSHLMSFAKGEKKEVIPGTSDFVLCRLPSPNQQDWLGPYAEGRMEFRVGHNVEWSLYYQYHRPYVVSKMKAEIDTLKYDSLGDLIEATASRISSVTSAHDVCVGLGGFDFKYHSASGWTFGTYFEGSKTRSHKARANIDRRVQNLLTAEPATKTSFRNPARLSWVRYQAALLAGYQF